MLRKTRILTALALAGMTFCLAGSAQAVTVGGQEFDRVLSISMADGDGTLGRLGYWLSNRKFYTYASSGPGAPKIDSVGFADDRLAGYDFDTFFAMGLTQPHVYSEANSVVAFTAPVKDGNIELRGANNEVLLMATYNGLGSVVMNPYIGTAGQLNITALFDISGGILSTAGILTGQLYVEMLFDSGVAWGKGDFHATAGTVNFYTRSTPGPDGEPIPEPASIALLLSGLAGAKRLRRNLVVKA